ALVLVPKGHVALAKLAQALAYGARTLLVRGSFDQCLELADEASERLGVYLLNSVNPFRLEGQKTIVLELLQQLAWQPPESIAVTDDEILEAKAVVDRAGIGCEPASAAAIAGTRRLARDGVIKSAERVVAILTGHVLKDPASVTHYHQERDPAPLHANRPIEIDPHLEEVERVMSR